MKTVTLHFVTAGDLLEFLQHVGPGRCIVDEQACLLRGDLTDAEIELALNGFGAHKKAG